MVATVTTVQTALLASLTALAAGSPPLPFVPRVVEDSPSPLQNVGDAIDVQVGFEASCRLGRTGSTILEQFLMPITIKSRYAVSDEPTLQGYHALSEYLHDNLATFHNSTMRVDQLLSPHPFDMPQAVGPGVYVSRFVLDMDVLRPVASITQDVTTPTKVLTSVRQAAWNALNNWGEWNSGTWGRKFYQDSDLDELALHDPGEFDLPALAITWGPTAPRYFVHTAQEWPATLNVVAWFPAHATTLAEYRAWQIVRAIYQSAPSASPTVSYIRAATGRIPEKDAPISLEAVELGRSGQMKALKLTCQFVLTGIVSPLFD